MFRYFAIGSLIVGLSIAPALAQHRGGGMASGMRGAMGPGSMRGGMGRGGTCRGMGSGTMHGAMGSGAMNHGMGPGAMNGGMGPGEVQGGDMGTPRRGMNGDGQVGNEGFGYGDGIQGSDANSTERQQIHKDKRDQDRSRTQEHTHGSSALAK